MRKTISTLEYGVKAKCIVHGPHTPIKAGESSSSDVFLGSKIASMKIVREREKEKIMKLTNNFCKKEAEEKKSWRRLT